MQDLHDGHARVQADQVGEGQRPHGVREAEPRDRVDRLGLGDALHQRVGGLVDERHEDAVRDEAGEVARLGRRLAEVLGELEIARAVSSEVSSPRITSTSFSTGTGLKKCMPITRSGRPVAAASERDRDRGRVGGEHGLARQRLVGAAEDVLLHARRPRRPPRSSARRGRGRPRAPRARAPRRGRRRPSRRAGRGSSASSRARARPRREGVVQRDAPARRRDHLGDARAHLAGADDEHVLESHAAGGYWNPDRSGGVLRCR